MNNNLDDDYEALGVEIKRLREELYNQEKQVDAIRRDLVCTLSEFGDHEGAEYYDRTWEQARDESLAFAFELERSQERVEELELYVDSLQDKIGGY